jgi:hypothetical protein
MTASDMATQRLLIPRPFGGSRPAASAALAVVRHSREFTELRCVSVQERPANTRSDDQTSRRPGARQCVQMHRDFGADLKTYAYAVLE